MKNSMKLAGQPAAKYSFIHPFCGCVYYTGSHRRNYDANTLRKLHEVYYYVQDSLQNIKKTIIPSVDTSKEYTWKWDLRE